jgi:TRAP-type C4-dicarboxylate transport system substrate-binding protein
LHKKQDESVVALVESKGMKVNKVNTAAFVEASKPIWDSFAKQMGEEAKKIIDLIEAAGK